MNAHTAVKKNYSPCSVQLRHIMRDAFVPRHIDCLNIGFDNRLYYGQTDAALKSSAADKQKLIELTLLEMAAGLEQT